MTPLPGGILKGSGYAKGTWGCVSDAQICVSASTRVYEFTRRPEEDFSCPVLSLSTLFSGDGSLCPRVGLAASELSDPPFSAPDNYPEVTGTCAATSSFS